MFLCSSARTLSRCASERFRSTSYPHVFIAVSTTNSVSLVSSAMGVGASAAHSGAISPSTAVTIKARGPIPSLEVKKRLRNPSRRMATRQPVNEDRRRTLLSLRAQKQRVKRVVSRLGGKGSDLTKKIGDPAGSPDLLPVYD